MTKKLPVLLILILSFSSYAQITFEKGYYIDNSGRNIQCLIKNTDWKNNPTEFQYKLSESKAPQTATIKSVQEFGISGNVKYIRSTVEIDRSSENLNSLSTVKTPEFHKEEFFLKVLVEGRASLYSFTEGNLKRFFYNTGASHKIEQLVFKKYLVSANKIAENNQYRQQLLNDLKCPEATTTGNIESVDYNKNQLVKLFIKYNECTESEFTQYKRPKKGTFHLTLRPGLQNSSLSVNNSNTNTRDTDFDNELGFRFGIEAEFILPYNKNKWAVIVEPTYQYYKSENETKTGWAAKVDYKSIELPLGIRHYFFLNDTSRIFVNASYVIDISLDSKIEFDPGSDLDIDSRNNIALGIGYNYNNKYSIAFRYGVNRTILDYPTWSSDYKSMSVILGYTIF